jgi:hypothetical protein
MGGPGKNSDEQLSKWIQQVEREFATNDNAAPSAVKPLDAQPSHPDEPSAPANLAQRPLHQLQAAAWPRPF